MKFLDMIEYVRSECEVEKEFRKFRNNIFIYNYIETYIIGYTLFYFAESREKC